MKARRNSRPMSFEQAFSLVRDFYGGLLINVEDMGPVVRKYPPGYQDEEGSDTAYGRLMMAETKEGRRREKQYVVVYKPWAGSAELRILSTDKPVADMRGWQKAAANPRLLQGSWLAYPLPRA